MKLGIVGLGDIAQKAYLPLLAQWPGLELVLCTRSLQTLDRLQQQYRIQSVCQDYRELTREKVDGVMIHAATSAHAQLASFFLRQGIPTFVDKPLADFAVEVEQLYELATKYNTPLYVGFNRRHIPLYNQYLPELANGTVGQLTSLRWEKHRHQLPGDIRTFIFDDFIHPLDSVNLNAQSSLDGVFVTARRFGEQLARIEVQWQVGDTLLCASMNRQFGMTCERVFADYANRALEFDSFHAGKVLSNNSEQSLTLKDWTPMLESKGFYAMIHDWLSIVETGSLSEAVIQRNIASHRLAEALCSHITRSLN